MKLQRHPFSFRKTLAGAGLPAPCFWAEALIWRGLAGAAVHRATEHLS